MDTLQRGYAETLPDPPLRASITNIFRMLEKVPTADWPEDMGEFYSTVAHELASMIKYASTAIKPVITFNDMRKAQGYNGTQYIWEFHVNDTAKPAKNEYNWHGQNTSQWCYAGCILLEAGKVSTHH